MVEIETECYYKDSERNVIGVQVTVYDDGDEVDTITITNPTDIDDLKYQVAHLDDTFISNEELFNILRNTNQGTVINASKLNGFASDKFLKIADKDSYSYKPYSHASQNNDYGWGTGTEYGHNKIIDNLTRERFINGESLAAHQGYELDKRIKQTETRNNIQNTKLHSHFNLVKRNGIVTLTVDKWDIWGYAGRTMDWTTVFRLSDEYKPVVPVAENVSDIYFTNIFDSGNKVLMRVKCSTGEIQVKIRENPQTYFYSHVTWIAKE